MMKIQLKNWAVTLLMMISWVSLNAQDFETLEPDKGALDASRKAGKLFEQGMEAYNADKFEEAIDYFTQSLAKSEDYFPARTNRGLTYLIIQKEEEAEKDLSHVVENHPESHAAMFGMGVIAMRNGDYETARSFLDKAVKIEYDNAEYHYALGKADDMIAQYEFAIDDFNEAIELDPKVKYYIERGNTYAKIEEFEKAEADYMKALEMESNSMVAKSNIMVLNSISGEGEEALEELNAKIDEEPENASYYMARGIYYFNLRENLKALKDFEKAVEFDGDNLYTHINKSAALIMLGKYKEAEDVATYIIDTNPELRQGYFNRGIAREMLRDKSGACEDWENAFLFGVDQAEEFLNSPICNE